MKTRDLWQIMSPESRRFAYFDFRSPGFAAGETPRPGTRVVVFQDDPFKASRFGSRGAAQAHLADEHYPLQRDRLVIVPAPQCGCCGATEPSWVEPADRELRQVAGSWHPESQKWRCAKHIDRLPCIIEGCGKTFPMKSDDTYTHIVMCGQHWRQAPKYMRDAVARVRKLAKRRGWDDALSERHHRLWQRCHRAIRDGQTLDMTEIERMFGI